MSIFNRLAFNSFSVWSIIFPNPFSRRFALLLATFILSYQFHYFLSTPLHSILISDNRKLVIIGDGACGKTSLLSVFTLGYFPTVSRPTSPAVPQHDPVRR